MNTTILQALSQELKEQGITQPITLHILTQQLTLYHPHHTIEIKNNPHQPALTITHTPKTTQKPQTHTIDLNHPNSIQQIINHIKNQLK